MEHSILASWLSLSIDFLSREAASLLLPSVSKQQRDAQRLWHYNATNRVKNPVLRFVFYQCQTEKLSTEKKLRTERRQKWWKAIRC